MGDDVKKPRENCGCDKCMSTEPEYGTMEWITWEYATHEEWMEYLRTRAEEHAMTARPINVPLTAENVADAVEVEDCFGVVSVRGGDGVWRSPGWEDESDRTMVECIKHHKFVVTKWRKG